jgi:hypothetical protein
VTRMKILNPGVLELLPRINIPEVRVFIWTE